MQRLLLAEILYQGSNYGEIARMILEEEIGTVVPYQDVETLQASVTKYLNNQELYKVHAQKSRRLAETTYGHKNAVKKYASVLMGNSVTNSDKDFTPNSAKVELIQ